LLFRNELKDDNRQFTVFLKEKKADCNIFIPLYSNNKPRDLYHLIKLFISPRKENLYAASAKFH